MQVQTGEDVRLISGTEKAGIGEMSQGEEKARGGWPGFILWSREASVRKPWVHEESCCDVQVESRLPTVM